jgi:hypothetical protein
MRATRAAMVVLLLCSGAMAQDAYGVGTAGSGGFVPVLSSNQAWMGNAGFALNVTHGLGGASFAIGPERLLRVAYDPINPGVFTATQLGPQYQDCYDSARGALSPDGSNLIAAATALGGEHPPPPSFCLRVPERASANSRSGC